MQKETIVNIFFNCENVTFGGVAECLFMTNQALNEQTYHQKMHSNCDHPMATHEQDVVSFSSVFGLRQCWSTVLKGSVKKKEPLIFTNLFYRSLS